MTALDSTFGTNHGADVKFRPASAAPVVRRLILTIVVLAMVLAPRPGRASETPDAPPPPSLAIVREAGLSLASSAVIVVATSWIARHGRELGFSKKLGVEIGVGGGVLIPPLVGTLLLRALAPDASSAGFWAPFAWSLLARTVSLLGLMAVEVGLGNNVDGVFLPGLALGAAIGGTVEALLVSDGGTSTLRSLAPTILSVGMNVAIPAFDRRYGTYGPDVTLASGFAVAPGQMLGVRVHAGTHPWSLFSAGNGLFGTQVDVGAQYRWELVRDGVRPLAAAWAGGFYDTSCQGDVCGSLGPAGGVELGLVMPEVVAGRPLVASTELGISSRSGAIGTFVVVMPAIRVGVEL